MAIGALPHPYIERCRYNRDMGWSGSGSRRLTYLCHGVLGYINKSVARSFDFSMPCRSKEWLGRRSIERHNSLPHSLRFGYTFFLLSYIHSLIAYSPLLISTLYTCASIYLLLCLCIFACSFLSIYIPIFLHSYVYLCVYESLISLCIVLSISMPMALFIASFLHFYLYRFLLFWELLIYLSI